MTTQACIWVDRRGKGESDVFDLLTHPSKTYSDLPVGDYHFVNHDTHEIIMIVERKTHSDLACSIKSRHMMEQLSRMNSTKETHPHIRMVLLLEGTIGSDWIDNTTSGIPNSSLETFLTSINLQGRIHVQYTATLRHTASWCTRMAKRIEAGKFTAHTDSRSGSAGASLSNLVSRADTRTKHNQWARLLCSIDGVSGEKALALVKVYPSPSHLFMFCRDVPKKEAINRMSDIKVRNRRLGPALAQKIVGMFSASPSTPESTRL